MSLKISLLSIAAATALGAATPSYATSEHPELVQLQFEDFRIGDMTYVPNSLVITAGQPYTLPLNIVALSYATWDITLNAGRSNSTPVAQAFIAASGGSDHVLGLESVDNSPSELHFFFEVDISADINNNPFAFTVDIGQGANFIGQNNWWIGSPYLEFSNDDWFYLDLSQAPGMDEPNLYFDDYFMSNDNLFALSLTPDYIGTSIPEPGSGALLAVGLAATLAWDLMRRQRGFSRSA